MSIETADGCEILEGPVRAACFYPGTESGALHLDVQHGEAQRRWVPLHLFDPAADVQFGEYHMIKPNSYVKNYGGVLSTLLGAKCRVKVWSRLNHDGSAVRAEFKAAAEGA